MEWLPGKHHKMFAKMQELKEFVVKKIQEHQDTLDPSSPRDYIDCFLTKLNQVRQNKPLRTKVTFVPFTLRIFTMLTHFLPLFYIIQ